MKAEVAGVLQQDQGTIPGEFYLPSTLDNISWGWLPTTDSRPVLTVQPGSIVTFDCVSQEGIMEDQGRSPEAFFAEYGVPAGAVMKDAALIARDHPEREAGAGPHILTGPVAVAGARPGDVLAVRVLKLTPRAPYGLISSRHGFGSLVGEMPEGSGPVFTFCEADLGFQPPSGLLPHPHGGHIRFPLAPFLGVMGVARDGERRSSIPPSRHGGNVDINEAVAGTTIYLPVACDEAIFYCGDPHFAQGDGEVALTAFEAPIRATLQLDLLPAAHARRLADLADPIVETPTHWAILGQDPDLDEALKRAVRAALAFLGERQGMPRALAYAYLSAAADFEVTQVVDQVKGVHCLIRKTDFPAW
ncbi:MAG TPA: acetamidase/formamidase family protein [Candidatus Dormibacteraeota bacterium]|nr:acetamidase/formamidase family protein [Candidatus Dormibacteraeota bacterium]